jgi:hypothetical protein
MARACFVRRALQLSQPFQMLKQFHSAGVNRRIQPPGRIVGFVASPVLRWREPFTPKAKPPPQRADPAVKLASGTMAVVKPARFVNRDSSPSTAIGTIVTAMASRTRPSHFEK